MSRMRTSRPPSGVGGQATGGLRRRRAWPVRAAVAASRARPQSGRDGARLAPIQIPLSPLSLAIFSSRPEVWRRIDRRRPGGCRNLYRQYTFVKAVVTRLPFQERGAEDRARGVRVGRGPCDERAPVRPPDPGGSRARPAHSLPRGSCARADRRRVGGVPAERLPLAPSFAKKSGSVTTLSSTSTTWDLAGILIGTERRTRGLRNLGDDRPDRKSGSIVATGGSGNTYERPRSFRRRLRAGPGPVPDSGAPAPIPGRRGQGGGRRSGHALARTSTVCCRRGRC